ncbi:Chloroplast import component protein (Tic20) [compost metagenome]
MNEHITPSSTGLDPKIAGLLCYVLGFVTGIIFLVIEKQSSYVKFHAMQSIIVFGSLTVLNLILGYIPVIGWIGSFIIAPLSFVLWIVLMLMALQGKAFKLPIAGDIAEKQSQNF